MKGVIHRGSRGTELGGYQAAMKILRSVPPRSRLLVAAVNDLSALGALRAARELGRVRYTAIIGHGFGPHPQLVAEIRNGDTPLVGSVAYFPEKYGGKALPLALRWLNKEDVAPSSHTDHVLVTKDNIDQYCKLS
jgi:ribose transport system substrate-binding protein